MAEIRIRQMPENLRRNLRLVALQDGISMNDWVIEALQAAVDAKGAAGISLIKPDPKTSIKK